MTRGSIGRSRIIYQSDKINVFICTQVIADFIYKLALVGFNQWICNNQSKEQAFSED